ncbi:hypothetical protein A2U01_0115683, partial [Trifolium medium]|nr:hypothetical protein [Trifolium medium]
RLTIPAIQETDDKLLSPPMKMVTMFQYSRNDRGKNAGNSRGKHRWIELNHLPSSPARISPT